MIINYKYLLIIIEFSEERIYNIFIWIINNNREKKRVKELGIWIINMAYNNFKK